MSCRILKPGRYKGDEEAWGAYNDAKARPMVGVGGDDESLLAVVNYIGCGTAARRVREGIALRECREAG